MGNFRHFFSISNHEANTTELHPKVRKTCFNSNEDFSLYSVGETNTRIDSDSNLPPLNPENSDSDLFSNYEIYSEISSDSDSNLYTQISDIRIL